MKKLFLAIIILFVCVATTYKVYSNKSQELNLSFDLVPDEGTAVKIAEAIWYPIYGEKIYSEKPFVATLKDSSIWIVKGTLNAERGGTAYIEIQKSDCKVIKVTHYR